MATKIIKGEHGFAISFDGKEIAIDKIVDEGKTLSLPQNPSNRRYFSIAAFEKHQINGELELSYKAAVTIGKGPRASKKSLTEYMNEADLKLYNEIISRAEAAKKADVAKPLTQVEKLQRQIEKSKARLAELTKAGE